MAVAETKVKLSDIPSAVQASGRAGPCTSQAPRATPPCRQVCSLMHRNYAKFGAALLPPLIKARAPREMCK